MEQNKYPHHDKLPLSLVVEELEKDAEFTDKALQILSVEVRGSAHIPMYAVEVLIDHWLDNRALNCYINNKLVDDVTALTMFPVDGSFNAGIKELGNWITISKDELAALLEHKNLAVPAFLRPSVKVSKAPPPGDDEEQAADDDTLAALFDPVPVDVLENIFPADGKWKSWTARAARKGLIHARVGTAMYNPYKAGMWFVSNGGKGLTIGHCRRRLANNHLPDRSMDKKYLLTGELD